MHTSSNPFLLEAARQVAYALQHNDPKPNILAMVDRWHEDPKTKQIIIQHKIPVLDNEHHRGVWKILSNLCGCDTSYDKKPMIFSNPIKAKLTGGYDIAFGYNMDNEMFFIIG